jgi:biopolymer transport protein ExbD
MTSPGASQAAFHADEESLFVRSRPEHAVHFDITAMIDLVFMLNIFFLVTTVAVAMAEMDLPVVRHCIPTDGDTAVVVSLRSANNSETTVHLGDDADAPAILDPDEQIARVREAAQEGMRSGKQVLLLKAERSVKLRDIQRIGSIAKDVQGIGLRLAVIEKE